METVYNKNTGLGGKVINIFCDYYQVKWFDGTTSTVDTRELEWRDLKKAYYYLPNLRLRIERFVKKNAGEIIGFVVLGVLVYSIYLSFKMHSWLPFGLAVFSTIVLLISLMYNDKENE